MSFSSLFPNLPRTNFSPEQKALQDEAAKGLLPGASPDSIVAYNQYKQDVASTDQLGSVGIFVADLSKKASEGISAIEAKFASLNPFSKAGALTPTSAEAISGTVSSTVAKAYGPENLSAKSQQDAAYARTIPQATAAQVNAAQQQNDKEDKSHLVSLTDSEGYILEFNVMPEIVENRSVDYEPIAPPQFPGAFQKYKGTQSVQWSVNATFISRTTDEATLNLRHLNRLRGWSMPFFGEITKSTEKFKKKIGAPPPVLKFKGLRKGIVGPVPVVITSLNWSWPRDVDYIPAQELIGDSGKGEATIPFPTVMTVAIQVVESFSTDEFNRFSLMDYRNGDFEMAFSRTIATANTSTITAVQQGQIPKQQEAQSVGRSSSSFSDTDPRRLDLTPSNSGAGAGRGFINPQYVKPALSEIKTAPQKTFKSGGGGDFGGGGASGAF